MPKDNFQDDFEQDYADYYEKYYGDLDEEEIESIYYRKENLINRSIAYVYDVRDKINETITTDIEKQKQYYRNNGNHALYEQQLARNRLYFSKLIGVLVVAAVVMLLFYAIFVLV